MSSTYTPQEIKDVTERISILRTKWLRLVEMRLLASQPNQGTSESSGKNSHKLALHVFEHKR
jgi:hypothetical protein